jgi:hypothetical protein
VPQERRAALVLSVWLESGQLRARLTSADTRPDLAPGDVHVAHAASTAAVVRTVTRWLEDFLRQAGGEG